MLGPSIVLPLFLMLIALRRYYFDYDFRRSQIEDLPDQINHRHNAFHVLCIEASIRDVDWQPVNPSMHFSGVG